MPIARQVRITRAAISPRLAIRILRKAGMRLHAEDAEAVRAPDDVVEGRGERDPERRAGVPRVDHPVVPDAYRRVEGVRLLLDLLLDRLPDGAVLRLVVRLARSLRRGAADDRHHARELLGP